MKVMLISELMLAELAEETRMTRNLLARIPNEKLDWKPAEGLHTISWNAAHLVEIVSWIPGVLCASEFDIAPAGAEPYVRPPVTDVNQLLQSFDANVQQAQAALAGVPDSTMEEAWSLKMGGQTLFTMKKGDCLRKWAFSHTAHHRGILSTYLRLAGVEFPSIYEE
jgi:uncharacterized damage-inducible protein DinB